VSETPKTIVDLSLESTFGQTFSEKSPSIPLSQRGKLLVLPFLKGELEGISFTEHRNQVVLSSSRVSLLSQTYPSVTSTDEPIQYLANLLWISLDAKFGMIHVMAKTAKESMLPQEQQKVRPALAGL